MAKILHVCNWASGITTRNITALKQYSTHNHELVTRVVHPYDMACEPVHLTERDTTKEMVLELAEEAEVLHFHAVGYAGSLGLPETIHGIDWSQFRGKKTFIFHGMVADLQVDGTFILRHGDRFEVPNLDHYDVLMGPHLSCQHTYGMRLNYVPDIIPIYDWLYMPLPGPKQRIAYSFKDAWVADACQKAGVNLRILHTPTKLTLQLALRRRTARVTFNGSVDGAWGLFALESMSQGIPSAAYSCDINRKCWDVLQVPAPPLLDVEYGGANAPKVLSRVMNMEENEWQVLSKECRSWIENFYNPRLLVKRWDSVYDKVL